MVELFKKIFSRTKRFLVIDFGGSIIDIIYLRTGPWGNKLLKYDSKRIPAEEKGKDDFLVSFIDDFIKSNSIRSQEVVISIFDEGSVFIKCIQIQDLPEKEVFPAIKWQIKDDVHFDIEAASFDWKVLRKYTNDEGMKFSEVICGVIEKSAVDRYLSIVESCGLKAVRLTTNAFNYVPALHDIEDGPSTTAVLNISCSDSTINIYKNNKLNFLRRVPVSWEKLTSSLMGVFGTEYGDINLSPEEAERIQLEVGIPDSDEKFIKEKIPASHLLPLMRPLLEALVRELKISFKYFTYNQENEMPGQLYITGCGANLKNLDKYLKDALGIDVSILPLPAKSMNMHNIERKEDERRMANILGAALDGPQAINMLPSEIKTKKEEFVQKATARVVATTICIILMFLLFVLQFRINDQQTRLVSGKKHLKNLGKVSELIQQYKNKELLLREIQSNKTPAGGLLKVIAELIPGKLSLNKLSFNQNRHRLTLKGNVSATEDVAESALTDFMESLEESPFFYEARLVSSQKMGLIQEFEIECDLVNSDE